MADTHNCVLFSKYGVPLKTTTVPKGTPCPKDYTDVGQTPLPPVDTSPQAAEGGPTLPQAAGSAISDVPIFKGVEGFFTTLGDINVWKGVWLVLVAGALILIGVKLLK